jgi:hypothetical protein
MFIGQDRNQLRQVFFKAWQKYKAKQAMEPLEQIIANVIAMHPEYHRYFEDETVSLDQEFLPEMGQTNPFLHIGLHISIHEQLSINQPFGISEIYKILLSKHQDPHTVEHLIMDCLAEMIWEAQRNNITPDQQKYLECLRKLQ